MRIVGRHVLCEIEQRTPMEGEEAPGGGHTLVDQSLGSVPFSPHRPLSNGVQPLCAVVVTVCSIQGHPDMPHPGHKRNTGYTDI